MASVALEQVGKVYPPGNIALRGIDLHVAAGELVVLVGPSGCGKTTLLRLIAGLDTPTSGTIRIAGRDVAGIPPRQRDIAMVFQGHNLYPHLSVKENLTFGLAASGKRKPFLGRLLRRELAADPAVEQRLFEVVHVLALGESLSRRSTQLSGGEAQRVALGRALMRHPAIFLLDEPLSQLDPPLRNELRSELHLLHRRICATMIYVTHDQMEAMALAQRLVVLDGGVVQQVDRAETIYARPRNRFVARFIGWPPMNFLAGRLVQTEGRLTFESDGITLPLPLGWVDSVASRAGEDVVLGIRPENVGLERLAPTSVVVPMQAALVEPLGSFRLVTFVRDKWRLSGRIEPSHGIKIGQTVEVALDMKYIHLFAGDSDLNLLEPG